MRTSKSITREDFIKRLMEDCDLSYTQALKVYGCVISLIEFSVLHLRSLVFHGLGALTPKIMPSRPVAMNFRRNKGVVEKVKRTFYLDPRAKFTLRLYKSFLKRADFQPDQKEVKP